MFSDPLAFAVPFVSLASWFLSVCYLRELNFTVSKSWLLRKIEQEGQEASMKQIILLSNSLTLFLSVPTGDLRLNLYHLYKIFLNGLVINSCNRLLIENSCDKMNFRMKI